MRSAAAVSLTVHVLRVTPLAEHRPIGRDLEVVAAVHAVEPGELPSPPAARHAELRDALLGRVLLRHPDCCLAGGTRPVVGHQLAACSGKVFRHHTGSGVKWAGSRSLLDLGLTDT